MLIKTLFSWLCVAVAVVMLGLGLICLVNPHQKLFYLIDIFTLPILSGAVIATALLFLIRQKQAAYIGLAATLVLILAIWPQAFAAQKPADRKAVPIRMVFANVFIRNQHPEKILPWLKKEDPDIVAMVEVNPWVRQQLMDTLRQERPYIVTRYDMVVASRWPIVDEHPGAPGFALITMTVKAPQGDLNLGVTHLTRPWPFKSVEDQPRQFSRLGGALAPIADKRFVLVGDFNTPPCAAQMHDFTKRMNLHTAPALWGTWIAYLPGFLRVNIDNAMASPDLNLSGRHAGSFDGSDHRPIVFEIRPVKP